MTAARLRVGTFNIQHGRPQPRSGLGERANLATLRAAAGAIRELDLDVLALQEVDRHQLRSGLVDQAAEFSAMLAMPHARFAAAVVGQHAGPRPRPASALGTRLPAHGNAILSRLPVRSWRALPLPGKVWVQRERGPGVRLGPVTLRIDSARVALAAVLDLGAHTLSVTTLHAVTGGERARAQLARALVALDALPAPRILTGDLNIRPDDVRAVTDRAPTRWAPLAAGATFPAHGPRAAIDHILGGEGVRALSSGEVHRLPISDHALLVAQVEVARWSGEW